MRGQYLAPFAETFKAGDQAVGAGSGQAYTIQAGPFKDRLGAYYVVQRGDGQQVPIHAENLRAAKPVNTWEHKGVTYDLSAQYQDHEGDFWRFTGKVVDGVPCVSMGGSLGGGGRAVVDVAELYGPLTKV
jgi:hypothetical protein